ncbi:MAG: metallophosphoesterase [Huintestinicola sp.]
MKKISKGRLRTALYILAGIFAVLTIAGIPLRRQTYEIYTDKLSENVRIVHLSDLHSCFYGKDMKTLTDAVDREAPDVILLTGDIYDEIMDNSNTRKLLDYIGVRYRCYYILGNHEIRTGDEEALMRETESYGITVLSGSTVSVHVNGNDILISGIDDHASGEDSFFAQLERTGRTAAERDEFHILMSHYPQWAETYAEYDFDLTVSGHAHGGQWRIPFLVNGLYAPDEGLFPEYAGGQYDLSGKTLIVSRGLARERPLFPRFFNNPEIVVIDLKGTGQ